MPDRHEVQEVVDALWAVYNARDADTGNTELTRRIIEIAKTLAANDTGFGKYGGIRKTAADAIVKAYLRSSLEHL